MSKLTAWRAFEREGTRVQANKRQCIHRQIELLSPKEANNSVAIFESACDEFFMCCIGEL